MQRFKKFLRNIKWQQQLDTDSNGEMVSLMSVETMRSVRTGLSELPSGNLGFPLNRFELEAWVDDYTSLHGRKVPKQLRKRSRRVTYRPELSNVPISDVV